MRREFIRHDNLRKHFEMLTFEDIDYDVEIIKKIVEEIKYLQVKKLTVQLNLWEQTLKGKILEFYSLIWMSSENLFRIMRPKTYSLIFLTDSKKVGEFEELFELISNSTLRALMLSSDDLTEYANDGVICQLETGPLGFLYIDNVGGKYAAVYSSESKIKNVSTPYNKYSHIVNFSEIITFILNEDMDSIIINPNSDNVLLTRYVLLKYCPIIEKTCNDSRLNSAIFHMFLIDEC